MIIKESAENYLEAILMLSEEKGYARGIEIANELSFTKASVSVAMKSFRSEGYIDVSPDGRITLTPKGIEIAEKIYARHKLIAKALIAIGVDEEVAHRDSCRIEHGISDESFEKIKAYLATKGIE